MRETAGYKLLPVPCINLSSLKHTPLYTPKLNVDMPVC